MKVIKGYSIGHLTDLVIKHIFKNGYPHVTENDEHTLETESISLVCDTPLCEPRISENYPFHKQFLEKYSDALLNGYKDNSSDFEYDYHTRLYDYCPGLSMATTNQIDYIVDKLTEHPESRRAQAITWIPELDTTINDCPCLQYIQCKIRDNKLLMTVMFRSNDMLLAFNSNAYALTDLQKQIADRLGLDVGRYTHISLIPHIYDIRDADNLKKFIK